jgi:putative FmdB family regulatory protein
MPIYEYRCEQGHTFEVLQRITEDPLAACQTCEAPVERVYHPVAVHFKGSGFYNTDYGTRKRQRETSETGESGSDSPDKKGDSAKPDSKSDSGSKKPSEKAETKAAA